ncbi:MAG: PQQ-binding-like beta-propeller repeat protein [Pirellulales bacterium]
MPTNLFGQDYVRARSSAGLVPTSTLRFTTLVTLAALLGSLGIAAAQRPVPNPNGFKPVAPGYVPDRRTPQAPPGVPQSMTPTVAPKPIADPTTKTTIAVDPMDWPSWRGPEQNGISRETGLISSVDLASKKNVLWKNVEAAGISTPVIWRGKLYTIVRHDHDTPREQEKVLCLNAVTGETIWEARHNVYLSDCPAERVGWSSCVVDPETGNVYAQGVNGYFECLNGETGKVLWSRSMHEEFGVLSTYGGRTNVPVVFDDLVIVSAVIIGWGDMARPAHRFLGMDKRSGEIRWFNGTKELPEDTTYSTPTIKVVDGQEQMIFGSSDGCVWAFQPRTGKPIWNYKLSRRGISVSPLVVGDTVYIAQGEENMDNKTMGCLVAINAKGAKGDITDKPEHLLWMQKSVVCGKSSPVLVDGRIYCVDDSSNVFIVEAATGKLVLKKPIKLVGPLTRASPLYADGKIFISTTSAMHILEPTAEGAKFLVKARLDTKDDVSALFIASHGRVYLQTAQALYCLGTPDQKPAAAPQPPAVAEPTGDDKPAWCS